MALSLISIINPGNENGLKYSMIRPAYPIISSMQPRTLQAV